MATGYDPNEGLCDGPDCDQNCEASRKLTRLEEINEAMTSRVSIIGEARTLHAEAEAIEKWIADNGECTCDSEARDKEEDMREGRATGN